MALTSTQLLCLVPQLILGPAREIRDDQATATDDLEVIEWIVLESYETLGQVQRDRDWATRLGFA